MDKREVSPRAVPVIIFVWMLILLIWYASYCISNNTIQLRKGVDVATVLFGAASIALFILSIFIAILTIFGWQTLQDNLRKSVETVARKEIDFLTKERIEPLERDQADRIDRVSSELRERAASVDSELRGEIEALSNQLHGRVFSILGFVIGETSFDSDSFAPKDLDRLQDAISNSQKGYEFLQRGDDGPGTYLALNNLVFYSCLVGDKSRAKPILEKAHLLRNAGEEHNNGNLLLTYCRAVLVFGTDGTEIAEARTIAKAIMDNPSRSERERKEAKQLLGLSSVSSAAEPISPTAM